MPVSCFRIAVCSSLAGKSEDQFTKRQDNHRHYLAIYFPRIPANWSNNPAPKFHDFWLFRRYCSPLPPGRPPLRAAQHQETAPAGGSNVGLGRGPFKPSAPPRPSFPPQLFFLLLLAFQVPSFVLSKRRWSRLQHFLLVSRNRAGKGGGEASRRGTCLHAPPRPAPRQGRDGQRPPATSRAPAPRQPRSRRRPAEPGRLPRAL